MMLVLTIMYLAVSALAMFALAFTHKLDSSSKVFSAVLGTIGVICFIAVLASVLKF